MSEKRKEERILKQIKAEVHYGKGMTFSTSIDISSSGIFISTPEPLTAGDNIKLSIQSGDGNFIDVDGIVLFIFLLIRRVGIPVSDLTEYSWQLAIS